MGSGGGWLLALDRILSLYVARNKGISSPCLKTALTFLLSSQDANAFVSCSADLSETCLDWFLVLTPLASSAELTFGPAKDYVVLVRAAAWAGENLTSD